MTREELYESHQWLIGTKMREATPQRLMRDFPGVIGADDLRQVASLAIWQATEFFDPTRHKFSTYAGAYIHNAWNRMRVWMNGAKRRGRKATLHLGDFDCDVPSREPAAVDAAIEVERAALIRNLALRMRSRLPPHLWLILWSVYGLGVTWDEIARRYGYASGKSAIVSAQSRLKRIMRRFRGSKLERDYHEIFAS